MKVSNEVLKIISRAFIYIGLMGVFLATFEFAYTLEENNLIGSAIWSEEFG